MLSARAEARLTRSSPASVDPPPGPYYDKDIHPEGCLLLSSAENSLLTEKTLKILNDRVHLRDQHIRYRSALTRSSLPDLDSLLIRYANDSLKPKHEMTAAKSASGPGIGALLAQLVWHLTEPGDGVLISTPYYHDYVRDIEHPAQAKVVLAHIPALVDSTSVAVLPYLEQQIFDSEKKQQKITCILVCSPHNPLGRCYNVETLKGYVELAVRFDLHLIVDEVFANSVYSSKHCPEPTPFTSVLSLDIPTSFKDRLHVLSAPTKDLGLSGLKAGLLISENQQLLQLMRVAMYATPISGGTDAILSPLLDDTALAQELLQDNKRLLTRAANMLGDWLTFHKLPFEAPSAGIFCLVDFSPIIDGLDGDPARRINHAVEMMIAQKVFLRPTGVVSADPMPNRFRLVFSHPEPVLRLALRRIEKAFGLEAWQD